MQTNGIFIAFNFVIRPQILILLVFKVASCSSLLVANKIFQVTVLSLVYFYNQFVAPQIRHTQTSLQCLSTITMVYSDKNKILIKKTH